MSPLAGLRLHWDTVRHLRAEQIYRRLWFRAVRPRPQLQEPPPVRPPSGAWVEPPRRHSSLVGSRRFRLLNEERSLDAHGWDDPDLPKLWRYNLHYFDDLNAEDAAARRAWHAALIAQWIGDNPPAAGTGWEPYPTSLRIVNWIKWALAGNALGAAATHSLAVQARWLSGRLEYHLLGNHLLANAKALVFAGLYFAGPEADRWLSTGHRILARELPEQILADGGNFELSPMYHALVLEDLLDIVNLTRAYGSDAGRESLACISGMRSWLAAMCHPDGEIAFFNDAAIGIAPAPAELERYAMRLGLPPTERPVHGVRHLQDSGYIRAACGDAVVFLDVGSVGPDYLPGHAHADTLSFELSLAGRRVLVNSGTATYGTSPERLRQRGTDAHNTVTVDGENSSQVWSGFRVAQRAYPLELSVREDGGGACTVACSHDGYRRLPGQPTHRRTWRLRPEGLAVSDTVAGEHRRAVANFHFHPDVVLEADNAGSGRASMASKPILSWQIERGRGHIESTTWHPEFGVSRASQRLVVELAGGSSHIEFAWSTAVG